MSAVCPVCFAEQGAGLLCSSCCDHLERELGDVPAIVAELDVTLSKQARLGSGGHGGLARERMPMNEGARLAGDYLQNTLTTWARDVMGGDDYWPGGGGSRFASTVLLRCIDDIRKHPAVDELVDEVTDAIRQARHAVDRPANRTIILVGPCPEQDAAGEDCAGTVFAFIPVEDARPGQMKCDLDPEHKWSSIQWYRAGKRILERAERNRRRNRGVA